MSNPSPDAVTVSDATVAASSSSPPPRPPSKRTILLALSGPSSSGKTTLARLLHKNIFPRSASTLIHLDDFYKPETELPLRDGLLDWDSAGALDLDALEKVLEHVAARGVLPMGFLSKEDANGVGRVDVGAEVLEELGGEVRGWWNGRVLGGRVGRVVIVDGFLLLGRSMGRVRGLFDVRVLLRASFEEAKRRREARSGYVTLEGWWEDPPGYVERVVWPGFVEEHGFLFEGGDVEGSVDEGVVRELGIDVGPKGGSMEESLRWLVDVVKKRVDEIVGGDKAEEEHQR